MALWPGWEVGLQVWSATSLSTWGAGRFPAISRWPDPSQGFPPGRISGPSRRCSPRGLRRAHFSVHHSAVADSLLNLLLNFIDFFSNTCNGWKYFFSPRRTQTDAVWANRQQSNYIMKTQLLQVVVLDWQTSKNDACCSRDSWDFSFINVLGPNAFLLFIHFFGTHSNTLRLYQRRLTCDHCWFWCL